MTDHFATLNEPRQPWLDAEELQRKFLALSAGFHPDHVHAATPAERQAATDRFAALNAAYQCLSEPRGRLRHLLELEQGTAAPAISQVPSGLTDLLMEAGELCRRVDESLARRHETTSPLLKVRSFEEGLRWTERVSHLLGKVNATRARLDEELRALNDQWSVDRAGCGDRLGELSQSYGYVARWAGQLQERLARLAV
jgi:DnaJ-domain-containing protein 1